MSTAELVAGSLSRCTERKGVRRMWSPSRRERCFGQLLEDAEKGQFDIIVVHTLDRWSRNLRVTLESLRILARHNVALVSITENVDYSTPQGKLFTQMLGAFGEYFSGALASHAKKGVDQRAREGRHLGGIPFGYESCWIEESSERRRCCDPEHPGGVHVHPQEGPAVQEVFRRYATGTVTLANLATWMNSEGFKTRNRHKLPDANGDLLAEPRMFYCCLDAGDPPQPLLYWQGEPS